MVTLEELKEREKEIENLVDKEIKATSGTIYPIKDGIIDIEKYFKAKYKILWILKEPYDDIDEDGDPCGGGWDFREVLSGKKSFKELKGGRQTYIPMTYTSWGILNDFCQRGDMSDVKEDKDNSLLEALQSVALINVKKMPGYTKSDDGVLQEAYTKHKNILLKQINDYEPDIIIGGYTLNYFWKDLDISKESLIRYNGLKHIIKDSRVFIDAYHPAQTTISQEDYCNDIINTAKIWAEN